MDKLLPCPHCGGFDTLAVSGIQIGTKTTWRTICDAEDSGCGAQGGTALTKHAAAAAWNRRAANAAPDPALLALAKLGAMVISGYLRQNDTAELCLMAGLTEETPAGHAHRFPGIIDAIAALLAPDGAESVVAP